ncbi:LTA synthase family protein [Dyadobacter sandarakinus]|uniref:Sulfatase-like hydrolase/transferase n=1 Tax=Dyadobacter sandarakinus TaxID=2747268 RepID=A0ABX7I394_9BACT|nr:alkaline phosphatase family protein [Dyadobacter sandarakinus]QRQ99981.1 sulfatase-like hydrolase/transferase [Dyadobacter sandarakinus]
MRNRIAFLALYGLCWTLLFQFFRIVFFLYHYQKALEIAPSLWASSAFHGLRMDISFASYLLLIPTLAMLFTTRSTSWYQRFMLIYSGIMAFVIVLLVVTDLELFRAWGFRIDGTSLHYLETPREAFASMGAAPVVPLLLLVAVLWALSARLLQIIVRRCTSRFTRIPLYLSIPVFPALAAMLIIPIRGGLQLAPMNESAVYFSDKSFANYAAVNVAWNFMASVFNNTYSQKNPFIYFEGQKDADMVGSLYPAPEQHEQVISREKPVNLIIIIWESFTAKVAGSLGGLPEVTPQFNRLSSEGLLFTQIYASGNRSDKGMVSILSGYPAQPTHSIIKIPKKTRSLPSLPGALHDRGWYTSFYYGGETEFANMKSYFLQQHFDRIIDRNDFDEKDMNSKWGAHDHVVLNRVINDLDRQKQPFFTTVFTLSSHEPFEVPVPTAIPGNDSEHLFLNAHHYTDEAIGDFIKTAKTKPWWDNTLIVILADHGHPLPDLHRPKPSEFHIPMLWLGGALTRAPGQVTTLSSQTDLAATLLAQFNVPAGEFRWSSDILSKNKVPFAYFAFNNGLGWMRPDGFLVRDNIGGNITERQGALGSQEPDLARAYLQASFSDYVKR